MMKKKTNAKQNTASSKRQQIELTNRNMLIIGSLGILVTIFCLFGVKALVGQAAYQNRVVSEKKKTLKQLEENIKARDQLVTSYKAFVDTPKNGIEGLTNGTGDRDGDNAKIVLDALPSKYDFPALTSSLEKLATTYGLVIDQMNGSDDEIAQQSQEGANPQPVPMQFDITVSGSYAQIAQLTEAFQKSIRPIQVQAVDISSTPSGVTAKYTAQTFYQPEKTLQITKKVVQ